MIRGPKQVPKGPTTSIRSIGKYRIFSYEFSFACHSTAMPSVCPEFNPIPGSRRAIQVPMDCRQTNRVKSYHCLYGPDSAMIENRLFRIPYGQLGGHLKIRFRKRLRTVLSFGMGGEQSAVKTRISAASTNYLPELYIKLRTMRVPSAKAATR
jgi:hypothetical protein